MTLDEAIKYLEQEVEFRHFLDIEPLGKAMQLGIEALKRLKKYRRGRLLFHPDPLPGETEE